MQERLTESPMLIFLGLAVIAVLVWVTLNILTDGEIGRIFCFYVADKFETFLFGWKPFTQICKLVVRF